MTISLFRVKALGRHTSAGMASSTWTNSPEPLLLIRRCSKPTSSGSQKIKASEAIRSTFIQFPTPHILTRRRRASSLVTFRLHLPGFIRLKGSPLEVPERKFSVASPTRARLAAASKCLTMQRASPLDSPTAQLIRPASPLGFIPLVATAGYETIRQSTTYCAISLRGTNFRGGRSWWGRRGRPTLPLERQSNNEVTLARAFRTRTTESEPPCLLDLPTWGTKAAIVLCSS